MRNLRIADSDIESRMHSPLGECLIQLDTTKDSPPVEQSTLDAVGWQEKWSAGREQISSRLALIEAELDRLASSGPEPPQLSVFDAEQESF